MKVFRWTLIGAAAGIAFGSVWHQFEPGLALYFWPVFGALMLGQHAYRSGRDKDRAEPPTAADDDE
jgi:hypothetical protein